MLTTIYGDLFYSPAQVLVNPVNTVGAMSKGLARDFKRHFPDMFEQYRALCEQDAFKVGQLMLYRTPHKTVLNFPTKQHFRADSSLDIIGEGLQKFASIYADQHITSISFPQLGAGEGELPWDEVRPLMEAYLAPLPITIYIHIFDPEAPDSSFPQPQASGRALRDWLNRMPQQQSFDAFWRMLLDAIRKQHGNFTTLTDQAPFQAYFTEPKGRQRLSVKLSPARAESIFLPETQLRDLWQYVSRAGYVLPQNLPVGLDAVADYVIALLAGCTVFFPVPMTPPGKEMTVGLLYVPPSMPRDAVQRLFTPEEVDHAG